MNALLSVLEKKLPRNKINIFGKDSLMKSSIPYYFLTVITLSGLFNNQFNPYMFIAIIYSAIPILDQVCSLDERNPTESERKQLQKNDLYFQLALYSALLSDWVMFFVILNNTVQTVPLWHPMMIGGIFIRSNLYSVQFNIAHQIMHKPGKINRIIGTLHMIKQNYMHFTYHHLYNHHSLVATPEDPSSAGKGQNVYTFIYNCVFKSWLGVYENQKKLGKSFLANHAVLSILGSIVFDVIIIQFFGWRAFLLHFICILGSIVYLQAINYIQHYGLSRKKLGNGQYQKTTILHSWNAPHRFSNYILFKLQRHSDHHQNSSKPYQTLVSLDKSPFLPHGYTLMILMSFFPNIWYRIMNPLVDGYAKLDHSKGQMIDPIIKQTAIVQTRKFLIQISFVSLLLLVASFFINDREMARAMSISLFK